jgi:hypothetical protein
MTVQVHPSNMWFKYKLRSSPGFVEKCGLFAIEARGGKTIDQYRSEYNYRKMLRSYQMICPIELANEMSAFGGVGLVLFGGGTWGIIQATQWSG